MPLIGISQVCYMHFKITSKLKYFGSGWFGTSSTHIFCDRLFFYFLKILKKKHVGRLYTDLKNMTESLNVFYLRDTDHEFETKLYLSELVYLYVYCMLVYLYVYCMRVYLYVYCMRVYIIQKSKFKNNRVVSVSIPWYYHRTCCFCFHSLILP